MGAWVRVEGPARAAEWFGEQPEVALIGVQLEAGELHPWEHLLALLWAGWRLIRLRR